MISSLTVGEKDDESPKGHKKGHFQALKFTSHGLAFCWALKELLTDADAAVATLFFFTYVEAAEVLTCERWMSARVAVKVDSRASSEVDERLITIRLPTS